MERDNVAIIEDEPTSHFTRQPHLNGVTAMSLLKPNHIRAVYRDCFDIARFLN
jgi:hypothetical protein